MKVFKYNKEDDYFLGNKKYKISPLKERIYGLTDTGIDYKEIEKFLEEGE